MPKKVLLLGHTGKMGLALGRAFAPGHVVAGRNSGDLDAGDFGSVRALVEEVRPDIIINAVAFLGVDACERDAGRALQINTLLPEHLARLAREQGIPLVHFSTDAVFNDDKRDYYTEDDVPSPLQVYGVSKYGGECLVRSAWERHYIFRLPILFGESGSGDQFVEKMLARMARSRSLRISSDIVSSPTYSRDAAERIRDMVAGQAPFGTYHIANEAQASLYELIREIAAVLHPEVVVESGLSREFPSLGRKNSFTPLRSVKTTSLRPWKEAVQDYCSALRGKG